MRLDLPGKTVAITGAGGGLGAGLARALRAHGANVALLDLTADGLQAQAAQLGGDRYARDGPSTSATSKPSSRSSARSPSTSARSTSSSPPPASWVHCRRSARPLPPIGTASSRST